MATAGPCRWRRPDLFLDRIVMYGIMLYMKTRLTFRVAPDLAEALRHLPNQTKFVENALREALGRTCPVCGGDGRVPLRRLEITNLRRDAGGRRLNRDQALQLRRLVRVARQVAATGVGLDVTDAGIDFVVAREGEELFSGQLGRDVVH